VAVYTGGGTNACGARGHESSTANVPKLSAAVMIAPFSTLSKCWVLAGLDLRHPLWEERKGRVRGSPEEGPTSGRIQFKTSIVRDGEMISGTARKLGLEGIVSKTASPLLIGAVEESAQGGKKPSEPGCAAAR